MLRDALPDALRQDGLPGGLPDAPKPWAAHVNHECLFKLHGRARSLRIAEIDSSLRILDDVFDGRNLLYYEEET